MKDRRPICRLVSALFLCALCGSADAADDLRDLLLQPRLSASDLQPGDAAQPSGPFGTDINQSHPVQQENRRAPRLIIEAYNSLLPTIDLQSLNADISTRHTGLSISTRTPLTEKIKLNVALAFEQSHYKFGNGQLVFPGSTEPFDDLYSLSARISLERKLRGHWSLIFGGDIGVAGELDADIADALTGGGFIGATYAVNEGFVISGGLAVRTQIEDDPLVAPFAIIRLRIAPLLRFDTTALPSGFSAALVAEITRPLEVSIFAGWQRRQWRLAGGPGRINDGVFRDEQLPIGVGITFRTSRIMETGIRAGVLIYREVETLDSAGVRLTDVETDPSPFITFRILFRF